MITSISIILGRIIYQVEKIKESKFHPYYSTLKSPKENTLPSTLEQITETELLYSLKYFKHKPLLMFSRIVFFLKYD